LIPEFPRICTCNVQIVPENRTDAYVYKYCGRNIREPNVNTSRFQVDRTDIRGENMNRDPTTPRGKIVNRKSHHSAEDDEEGRHLSSHCLVTKITCVSPLLKKYSALKLYNTLTAWPVPELCMRKEHQPSVTELVGQKSLQSAHACLPTSNTLWGTSDIRAKTARCMVIRMRWTMPGPDSSYSLWNTRGFGTC